MEKDFEYKGEKITINLFKEFLNKALVAHENQTFKNTFIDPNETKEDSQYLGRDLTFKPWFQIQN